MFRRRETGGTAAIWKKDIDQHIEILPDGSDRIMALIIKSGEHDILAINSYMLTLGCSDRVWRNTKWSQWDYNKILCHLLWTGDLNADVRRMKGYSNDQLLREFLQEHSLAVSSLQCDTPTYHHFNGGSTSRLDLFVEKCSHPILRNFKVGCETPTQHKRPWRHPGRSRGGKSELNFSRW